MPESPSTTLGPADQPGLKDPVNVFSALGSKVRWPIIKLLADGEPRTPTEVAKLLKRDFDGVSKHLRLLSAQGLLECRAGEDRRFLYFSLPAAFRREPGTLDFGVCTIRLPRPPA